MTRKKLRVMFERYGTRAAATATYMNGGTDFILKSMPDYSRRELVFLVQHEKICHLDDFVLRRSLLAMLGHVSRATINELAEVFGNELDWDAERKQAEVVCTLSILADRHGVWL